ncbi:autotransporter domain-containing protein [uncultured Duodenibacillus sp.]|uniref:autotransporter domain-containing protein n=1 Tax=uncultured Duodenibacillus sp. TaxID=1980699 RepID=UPI002804C54A|nr:autotransporter domain-containing protein [uncultured Duodenibacillus sp.]
MNKSFKVVFSKARSALMVVNEATSSIQAKGTKTVIAVAAAMVAGGAMAGNGVTISPNMDMVTPSGTDKATHAAVVARPSVEQSIFYNGLSFGTAAKVEGVKLSYDYQAPKKDDQGHDVAQPNVLSLVGGTLSGFDVAVATTNGDAGFQVGLGGSVFEAIASPNSSTGATNNLHVLVDGVTFADNHATARGGVGFVSGVADFKIQNSIHTGNKVDADGGVYQIGNQSTGTITGSTFSGNSAKNSGGALRVSNSTVTIDKSVFDGNTAKVAGGAIKTDNTSDLTITNSSFTNNVVGEGKTGHGGAVFVSGTSQVNVTSSEFTGNKAGHGGAFYIQGQTATFTDTVFTNNEAYEYGGALRVNTGNVTFKVTKGDVAYTGNKAGTAADSVAGQRYNGKTGGFLYLQSAVGASGTATFKVSGGATLTIGKDATADSIASYSKTNAVSTITKTGAGDLVVNGDMSAFVGNLTVSSGSMTIAGGIGEYDLAVQEAVNNLVKDGNAPSDSGVATTVTVADQAALTVGNLTVTKALAVNANGDFTAGNITVTKGTYKDLKVLTGEKAVADHSTTGAATITVADAKTAKAGDITVDAGTFEKLGAGSLTAGNAAVNSGTMTVSSGSLSVKDISVGTSGTATVAAGTKLEVTGTITGEKQKLGVTGTLATTLGNVVDYADGKATTKQNAVVKFETNSSFEVTDEGLQYTTTQWDSIKTAAGSSNLKIANGTLVAADAKTPLTLADVGAVQGYAGAADIVETAASGTYTNAVITKPTAIGKLTVNAKDANTKLTSVTLNGTEQNKFTLRGNAKGEVLAVPSDVKTIDISHVRFGEKAADHGVVTNALKVTTDAGVDAGSFDFKGDVELKGAFSVAKDATARFLGDVKDGTTTDRALLTKGINNEGTTVVGTVPAADATDKTLQVNASTQTLNGGLTVYGAKHEVAALQYKAAAANNNVIYVGEQTTLNQNQQFGTLDTTTDPKAANVVAIDLASVAANGYTDKSGAVLKTAADSTVTVSAAENGATYSVDLLNFNSKVLTITETGASLNLGKALAAADVVMLHNAFYADGKVAADGTFAVVTDEEAVLEVETSGLHTAGAVVQAVRSYEKPTNGIAAIVYNNWKAWDQEYNQAYFDQAKAAGLLKETATVDNFDKRINNVYGQIVDGKLAQFLALGEALDKAQSSAITNAEHAATNMAVLGGAFTTTLDVNDQVTAVLNRRMSLANLNVSRNEAGVTPWVDVFGTMNEGKRLFGNGAGYEADIYGAVLGFDYTATCGGILGLAINVGTSDGNSTGNGQKVDNDQDFYGVSAYASRQFGSFNTKLDLGYLVTKNDLKTASSYFGATSEKLNAKVFTVGLGAEFLASAGAVNVVPHAGIRLTTIDMDESNYGADYDKMTVYQLPLGVTFSGSFDAAGWQVAPQFDLSVVPTFGDKDAVATYAGNVKDTTRVVDTNPIQATLGVSAQNGAWTFGLNYGLTAGGDDRMNNSLNANVRYTF